MDKKTEGLTEQESNNEIHDAQVRAVLMASAARHGGLINPVKKQSPKVEVLKPQSTGEGEDG